nr:hypothetical protein [Candidatus Gracilibacteria bacterium]
MLFTFLKQQKVLSKKRSIVKTMILALNIEDEQKSLYLESLDALDELGLDNLYKDLTIFVEKIEIKEIKEIEEKNFSSIAGMRKREAEEKKKEINSFSFLVNNL